MERSKLIPLKYGLVPGKSYDFLRMRAITRINELYQNGSFDTITPIIRRDAPRVDFAVAFGT